MTGDLVNLSLSNEFGPARAWLDAFGSPHETTFVPGNHDAYVRAAAGRAAQDWGDYMRGDAGETFPFVRRRGKVALIGLSTSLPTLPLAATGRLGNEQLARLGDALAALKKEELFRVILIHHPPIPGVSRFRRLHDAAELREVLRKAWRRAGAARPPPRELADLAFRTAREHSLHRRALGLGLAALQ